MGEKLAARVRARLREEMARLDLSQREVSDLLNWSDQGRLSKILNGLQGITLEDLETLCFAVGLLPTEVVRDRGYEFSVEMTPAELNILKAVRLMSPAERDSLYTLL